MVFGMDKEARFTVNNRRIRLVSILLLLSTLVGAISSCGYAGKDRGSDAAVVPASGGAFNPIESTPAFRDVTEEAGLNFKQSNGGCSLRYFPEQFAAGAAGFDANGDG